MYAVMDCVSSEKPMLEVIWPMTSATKNNRYLGGCILINKKNLPVLLVCSNIWSQGTQCYIVQDAGVCQKLDPRVTSFASESSSPGETFAYFCLLLKNQTMF